MSIFVILWCIRHMLFVDVLLHLVWFHRMNWNHLFACAWVYFFYIFVFPLFVYLKSFNSIFMWIQKKIIQHFVSVFFFYSTNFYSIKAMFWQNLACSIFILIFNDETRNQFLCCNNFQSNSSSFFFIYAFSFNANNVVLFTIFIQWPNNWNAENNFDHQKTFVLVRNLNLNKMNEEYDCMSLQRLLNHDS